MSKRYRSNYSLWPEQARPRRAIPVTLAVGGFAVGIVCAVAAHNVVTDFLRPTATLETPQESASTQGPVYATAAAPAAAPEAVEPASRTRPRAPAAKMTLPSIGTRAAAPSAATDGRATDGRGGDTLAGETPVAALAAAPPAAAPSKPIEEPQSKPAEQSSTEPSAQPKAKAERSSKPTVRRTVKKKRAQPSTYATRRNVPFFGYGGPGYYGGYGGQVYARQQYYY
jgi:hypothetical protein